MRFQDFFQRLSMHFCNHGTLIYANYVFLSQFIDENGQKDFKSFNANIPPFNDRFELSNHKIKELIDIYQKTFKLDYQNSLRGIWLYNSKSINARAINAYYELIKKYLDIRGKKEIYDFHKYDWFRVLYILRQVTSHGDNIFRNGVEFPDRGKTLKGKIVVYPDTISWQNISITRGQKDEIIVNEVQISNLLSHINLFFAMNNDFNVGISDIQNFQKPK